MVAEEVGVDVAKMEQARGRFTAAVEKLEAAAEQAGSEKESLVEKLAAASAERDRLAGELATLQESHRSLEALTQTVTGRLDGTIERVR